MTERNVLLDRLNDVHSFPGPFVFKVIGTNSEQFISLVVETTAEALGRAVDPDISTRESSGGKHLSVTMSVEVKDAESVLDVYAALRELEEAKFIL